MAAAPVEKASPGEADEIRRWRFEELLSAGYTIADALELALRHDIDLHWAASLVPPGLPELDRSADRAVGPHDAPAPVRPGAGAFALSLVAGSRDRHDAAAGRSTRSPMPPWASATAATIARPSPRCRPERARRVG